MLISTSDCGYTSGYAAMKKELCLDGPAIPFVVGTESKGHKSFYVPLSILATYSVFFHDLHSHCTIEESENEIIRFDLSDTDPRTFNRFTIWLYYQGIFVDEDISEPLEYYYQFLDLWAIADRYRVPQLQRQAADATITLLRYMVEQTDLDVLTYWRDAYDCSLPGSPERRFIAGQCAVLLVAGQEASFEPETVHPALRGDIVSVVHDLFPQLF